MLKKYYARVDKPESESEKEELQVTAIAKVKKNKPMN